MVEHVLCVYPYRKDLKNFMFVPPLGLEIIGRIIEPFARTLDIVDLRTDPGQTRDHLCAATDMVCFSVNWKRRPAFIRRQILRVAGKAWRRRRAPDVSDRAAAAPG